jgi:hypothetical protein
VNLLQALDDDQLVAPLFAGSSWAPWRAFLKALFALPMADAELDLYRRHTERLTPPAKSFNEAALVIGRRGGKSRILALVAVYLACFRDYAPTSPRARSAPSRSSPPPPAGARDLQVYYRATRRRADALRDGRGSDR